MNYTTKTTLLGTGIACLIALGTAPAMAKDYGLGRPATDAEIAAWDIDIRPDGQGLPIGRGSVADGDIVYQEQCAVCHGVFGEAVGRWPILSGGFDTLDSEDPVKTIGSYWPYLSTVWDYVHRAMPFGNAQSLTDDQVYAITAYLLYLNDEVDDDFELSHENFASTRLPNEDNFFMDDRDETELTAFVRSASVCMENCKESVEITARARVIDVTPEQAGVVQTEAGEAVEVASTEAAPAAEAEPETAALDPELIAKGEKVFKKCQACHQVGDGAKNRVGPILNGVMDAPVGRIDDFKYSKVFQEANANGDVWTQEAMASYLSNPKAHYKGTKMSFRGLKKDADIEAVVTYLRSYSE